MSAFVIGVSQKREALYRRLSSLRGLGVQRNGLASLRRLDSLRYLCVNGGD